THDALTGIWNRRAMMDTLERELSSLRRERAPMTIMLGDLDHFKEIDDAHGHLVGDEVLREVARRLKLSVRPYDFVGRYGAEEFLMVLLNCGQAEALGRAEEARKLVVNDRVQTAAGPLRVTISLGVAVVCDCPDQLEKILSAVDLALYQAKAGGRDCVRLATAGDLLAPTSPMIHRVPSPDK
ncbi:MAG: GGDEF domain-containing protein, partial [Acidobacteriaceae bacterium]